MARRILHIIDALQLGGDAKQMLLLSQALVAEGWDVHVAALASRGGFERHFAAARIPVTTVGRRWPVDPLADLALSRHVARLRPDVVHTWDTIPGLLGPIVNRQNGRPRIIAGVYRIRRATPSWEWLVHRRFARHVDCFVSNSPTVRDWHAARGLPAKKFTIIPSGLKYDCPPPRSGEALRPLGLAVAREGRLANNTSRNQLFHELDLPPDARLIGVVGRLTRDKRVKDLIWAADLLRVLHDNLRVLIIGDGPQREQLVRYARLASDLDHIRFLGERDDVDRILPHLDVLWNASENTGQSLAILEAMAAGVPVIASDTPTNRELILENETGFLIPLHTRAGRAARARHTDQIFNDPSIAVRLSASSCERVRTCFFADTSIRRLVELCGNAAT